MWCLGPVRPGGDLNERDGAAKPGAQVMVLQAHPESCQYPGFWLAVVLVKVGMWCRGWGGGGGGGRTPETGHN